MTSFTTEDRIAAENTSITDYRTQIGFSNLISDCYKLGKRCNNFDFELRLKNVANTIAEIGNEYNEYLKANKE
jgi:hypothetical protein